MKVIIQCAGRKRPNAGRFKTEQGREVVFVAHPERAESRSSVLYCRPDDPAGIPGRTWRDILATYNQQANNPLELCQAVDLYAPKVYLKLAAAFGRSNVLILSAGWGLIRADFLVPDYDITFSSQGEPSSRREIRSNAIWKDFNQLQADNSEEIHFFGGRDYLNLYYKLTLHLGCRKIIHFKGHPAGIEGYKYILHDKPGNTNWHYTAAIDFIATNKKTMA